MTANQNFNLIYGWDAQTLGPNANGVQGYAQVGNAPQAPGVSAAEQASSGASAAPAPTNVAEVLTNPGYAASPALMTPGPITAPAIGGAASGVQNPSGLAAAVVVTAGSAVTVSVAPNVNGAAGTYVAQGAAGTQVSVTVPPGGYIKSSGAITGWTWVAVL